ncbi:hypothetical protein GGI1_09883, partial [Acidithiobacillus sp. GGI-221]
NIRIGTFWRQATIFAVPEAASQQLGMAASPQAPRGRVLPQASSQPATPQQPQQQTIPLQ